MNTNEISFEFNVLEVIAIIECLKNLNEDIKEFQKETNDLNTKINIGTNLGFIDSAIKKLNKKDTLFKANELKVMYGALDVEIDKLEEMLDDGLSPSDTNEALELRKIIFSAKRKIKKIFANNSIDIESFLADRSFVKN